MSNLDQIKELIRLSKLIEFQRRDLSDTGESDKYRRWIYLGIDLNGEMASRSNEPALRRLYVLFQIFTSGKTIPVALDRDHKKAQWARLDPAHHEVWETRVRHQSPELRILGRFACRDVFVALHLYEGWELNKPVHWNAAIARCQGEWSSLFPHSSPVIGSSINDYISANFTPI